MQSCIGLGDIIRDSIGIDSQAYSGLSAIDTNPTREASIVSSNGQIGAPDPVAEPIQQAVESSSERVSPTLPWSAKPLDNAAPTTRSNQHPIAPTKKKERPSVKPSCKKEAVSRHTQPASRSHEQDVEMTDAPDDNLIKQGLKPGPESCSSKDPIESYGSAKPNNDDMEVDSDGANPNNLQQRQADRVQRTSDNKPSKDAIAAIASPQKPRHDLGRPTSPKELPSNSVANNNNARRPPGITILQHSAILAKGREKKLESRHCPKTGKRQSKTGHPVTKSRGAPNQG